MEKRSKRYISNWPIDLDDNTRSKVGLRRELKEEAIFYKEDDKRKEGTQP